MRLKYLFLVLAFLVISISGYPQNTQLDSAAKTLIVNLTDIGSELEITITRLKSYEENNYQSQKITTLDSLIDDRFEKLGVELAQLKEINLSRISKTSLNASLAEWEIHRKENQRILGQVRKYFDDFSAEIENVKKDRERWQVTLKDLKSTESPEELHVSIKAALKDLNKADEILKNNLGQLVTSESKLHESEEFILVAIGLLESAFEQRSKDVFTQNSPVIWKVIWNANDSLSENIDMDSNISNDNTMLSETDGRPQFGVLTKEGISQITAFLSSSEQTILIHLFLWIITLIVSFKYGRGSGREGDEINNEFANQCVKLVRNHLFITATYLTILFSVFLYDYIPILLSQILVIILMVFNVIILHRSQSHRVMKIALIVIFTYALGQLNSEIYLSELWFRVFIFGKITFVIWAVSEFVKYLKSFASSDAPKFWNYLGGVANFTYVLLVISLIANTLGFVKMADLGVFLVVQILTVSFIFYGILITGNGLVAMFFTSVWKPQSASSLKFRNGIENIALKVVNLFAVLFWLKAILSTVGIYNGIKDFVIGIFIKTIQLGSVSISLEMVVYGIIVIFSTFLVTRLISILIKEGALDKFNLNRGVPHAISLVVRYTIIVLGFMLALSVAGVDLSSFSLMAGALGIGIGFGLQNIISNFVSGLILVFERPLQEGDVVEVNNLLGRVKHVGVRSSNIRTYSGSEVVVPNEILISKELVNWTLSDPNKRMEIKIGVEYGTDPRRVIELLKEATSKIEGVESDPKPSVYFNEFGDFSLNFRLLFWVNNERGLSVRSEVMLAIIDILKENNIVIPFPVRTLKIEESSEKAGKKNILKDQRRDVDGGV